MNNLPAALRSLATELEGTDYAFDEVCREAAKEVERTKDDHEVMQLIRKHHISVCWEPGDDEYGMPRGWYWCDECGIPSQETYPNPSRAVRAAVEAKGIP